MIVSLSNAGSCDVKEGTIVNTTVTKVLPSEGVIVSIDGTPQSGRVHITDISDEWKQEPLASFKVGQPLTCLVIGVRDKFIDLSTRASRLSKAKHNLEFPELKSAEDIQVRFN